MKRLSKNALTYQPKKDDLIDLGQMQGQENPEAWADAVATNRTTDDADFDDGNITP